MQKNNWSNLAEGKCPVCSMPVYPFHNGRYPSLGNTYVKCSDCDFCCRGKVYVEITGIKQNKFLKYVRKYQKLIEKEKNSQVGV